MDIPDPHGSTLLCQPLGEFVGEHLATRRYRRNQRRTSFSIRRSKFEKLTPVTGPFKQAGSRWATHDNARKERAYPDQPPVIPHSIEGCQLSVNTNRCLSCHKRELTQESGAPMISVTHDAGGQMLADVSPRRYFCTACHVPQADVRPLVGNTFRDMSEMGVSQAGSE